MLPPDRRLCYTGTMTADTADTVRPRFTVEQANTLVGILQDTVIRQAMVVNERKTADEIAAKLISLVEYNKAKEIVKQRLGN